MTAARALLILRVALASGISARKLAKEAGLSPTLLSLVQSGHRELTTASAEKLASALERLADRATTSAVSSRAAAAELRRLIASDSG